MSDLEALRQQIKNWLVDGLATEVEPRAYSHEAVTQIITRLQSLEVSDYRNKLIAAGFTLQPYGDEDNEQACETCMYYKTHQRFCELPELMMPVEADWSCRLWRI